MRLRASPLLCLWSLGRRESVESTAESDGVCSAPSLIFPFPLSEPDGGVLVPLGQAPASSATRDERAVRSLSPRGLRGPRPRGGRRRRVSRWARMTLLEVVLMIRESEGPSWAEGVAALKMEGGGKRRVYSLGSRREYSKSWRAWASRLGAYSRWMLLTEVVEAPLRRLLGLRAENERDLDRARDEPEDELDDVDADEDELEDPESDVPLAHREIARSTNAASAPNPLPCPVLLLEVEDEDEDELEDEDDEELDELGSEGTAK